MRTVKIIKSDNPKKKYMAIFDIDGKKRTVHFGSAGSSDYTIHKDKARRQRYLDRHRVNENWDNPLTAGSLARWILWGESTSLNENIKNFKKRFNFD